MEHTPEPWALDANGRIVGAIGPERTSGMRNAIAIERSNFHQAISQENRRRIVACVNFCSGEDIEYLESAGMGGVGLIRNSVDELVEAEERRTEDQ